MKLKQHIKYNNKIQDKMEILKISLHVVLIQSLYLKVIQLLDPIQSSRYVYSNGLVFKDEISYIQNINNNYSQMDFASKDCQH